MTNATRQRLLYLRAQQEADAPMPCPRCGANTMKQPCTSNALSRYVDLHICDSCGTAEALLAFMNQTLPLHQWYAFLPNKPPSDYITRPVCEVMALVIQKHIDDLTRIFRLCAADPENAMEYRNEAFERCAGLTELWVEPFQAKFTAQDGIVFVGIIPTDDGTLLLSVTVSEK